MPPCLDRPVIMNISQDHSVLVDGRVTLQCVADGNPSPQIVWWYRDQPLDDTMQGISFNGNGTLLTFDSVKPGHAGWYTCVATNLIDEHRLALKLDVIGQLL